MGEHLRLDVVGRLLGAGGGGSGQGRAVTKLAGLLPAGEELELRPACVCVCEQPSGVRVRGSRSDVLVAGALR
eukprot:750607-Prorocentrum_minimum.AAC.7